MFANAGRRVHAWTGSWCAVGLLSLMVIPSAWAADPIVGACCLPDGTCVETSWDECVIQCGFFGGPGTACAGQLCPIPLPGACCLPDGTCEQTAGQCVCRQLGGSFQGPTVPCGTALCPELGACCLPDGTCVEANRDDCDADCGFFGGSGTVCADQLCPIPLPGACCLPDGTCEQTAGQCVCEQLGGTYQGPTVPCGIAACPDLGACCLPNGTCVEIDRDDCDDQCGFFGGTGTVCAGQLCPIPVPGACCLPDGTCQQTAGQCICEQLGGTFQNLGTTCSFTVCPRPGACCLPDGTCEDLLIEDCVAQCGSFEGDGTTCSTQEFCCIELDRACCLPDGSCIETSECECEQLGGVSRGPGSACEDDVCPSIGACCLPGGTCEVTSQGKCADQCGFFQGEGSVCGPFCILPARRACCLPDGTCIDTLECKCELLGGSFNSAAGCATTTCLPPRGACCMSNGTCVENVTQESCEADCGLYRGDGSACDGLLCPLQLRQACCLPNGTCANRSPCVCLNAGGVPQGPGSNCFSLPNVCSIIADPDVIE